ncbi:IPT/TIG domain-containing protein [Chryseolinea lacunae]|uniref:IPT/TIG domain-containing protein n=1 Tax=Chryseolinea lacunae TaxID=2801331 RepID=A0ABS1KTV3_9BACT|nr:IPT/TIG domain-containing protein [Chryseolinea lacunae]MBL0742889.1 IPT/TIG domain-containing protein [Chryseolinea lacunae]
MKKFPLSIFALLLILACSKDDALTPVLLGIDPNVGKYNDVVTINGANFATDVLKLQVTFNGVRAEIVSATPSALTVKVPPTSSTGKVSVVSDGQTLVSTEDFTVLVGDWEKRSDAPKAGQQYALETFTVNNKAYVLLGEYSTNNYVEFSTLWLYDESEDTWTAKSTYSMTASLSGSVSWGSDIGKAYVLEPGGLPLREYDAATDKWSEKQHPFTAENQNVNLNTAFNVGHNGYVLMADKALLIYDIDDNNWTKKATFPGTLINNQASAHVIGDKAYVLTGNTLWQYDPATDKWTQKAGLDEDYTCTFAAEGKFYAGDYARDARSTFEYNPATDRWTQKASFSGGARIDPLCISVNNRAFVGLGKQQSNNTRVKDMYEFLP